MSAVTVYVHWSQGAEPVRLSGRTAAVLLSSRLDPYALGGVREELERERLVELVPRGAPGPIVSNLTALGWRVRELLLGDLS